MVTCIVFCFLYKRYDLLLFFLIFFCIIHILHLIIVSSTTLPDSSKKCKYSKDLYESMKNMGTCNNLGSSNHLMNLGLSLFILSSIHNHKYWLIYLFIYIIGFFTICASRNHYTLDCIVSTLILCIIISNSNMILTYVNTSIKNCYDCSDLICVSQQAYSDD